MKFEYTERILSLSALVTAMVAVTIGVVESRRNHEHRRLSVEPYLQIANTGLNGYQRVILNSGLGPARIESVSVAVDGEQATTWTQAIQALTGTKETGYTYGTIWKGQQLQAGQQYVALQLAPGNLATAFHANVGRLKVSVCYCSIYRDCWVVEGNKPEAVKQCPTETLEFFPLN